MHLARQLLRVVTPLAAVAAVALVSSGVAYGDKVPLLGSGTTAPAPVVPGALSSTGLIVAVDPGTVPCSRIAAFSDVEGGDTPGINYDGVLWSGTILFAERFVGQTVGSSGDFDVVSGAPTDPLTPQEGLPGRNLDVFTYTTNVLAGLGPLGFPDLDAIGEGSIAIAFPVAQSQVSFQLVGGNGGSATLSFYRADGSLIDTIDITGLGEFTYGFKTLDGTSSISGILIQSTDPSGMGIDNVCHEPGVVGTRAVSWGSLKTLYR